MADIDIPGDACISGSLRMIIQMEAFIETRKALGSKIHWFFCNILSSQDHVTAVIACDEYGSVFVWKRETTDQYWQGTLN